MSHSGWQISTLQEPEIIQLEIYGPSTEQNIISALSETLALAQRQNINKVLIDKRKTAIPPACEIDDPLAKLVYQVFWDNLKEPPSCFQIDIVSTSPSYP